MGEAERGRQKRIGRKGKAEAGGKKRGCRKEEAERRW